MKLDKPVFILGAHKSGTSLLRNLFDGHPDLFVIPIEAHFFQYGGVWVDYAFRRNVPENLSIQDIKQKYISWIIASNISSFKLADSITRNKWDIKVFERYLLDIPCSSFHDVMIAYVKAMYFSLHGKEFNPSLRIVEKSVEHAEFAIDLHNMFSNSKFIHIIRNPYANLTAIRKFKTVSNSYPLLRDFIFSLKNSYYYLWKNQRVIKNYKVIRYEDLVNDPEKILAELIDFIEIEPHDCLFHPSSLNETWAGNTSYGIKQEGISNKNIDRWRKEITHLEIYAINKYFPFVLEKYGYQKLPEKKNIYLPVKQEKIKSYIFNRMFVRLFN